MRDIFFDPESHVYLVDGQEVPSVTQILKPLTDRGYLRTGKQVLLQAITSKMFKSPTTFSPTTSITSSSGMMTVQWR